MASQSNEDESKMTFEKWMEGSISYTCVVCQMRFPDPGSFFNHTLNVHKMDGNQYIKFLGKPRKVLQIKCQICSEAIDHEPDSLKTHIQENHMFPLQLYFETFVDGHHRQTPPRNQQEDSDNDVVFIEQVFKNPSVTPSQIKREKSRSDPTSQSQDPIVLITIKRENIESEQGSEAIENPEAQNSSSNIVVESAEATLITDVAEKTATCSGLLEPTATCSDLLQPTATCSDLLQPTATSSDLLQPTATSSDLLEPSTSRPESGEKTPTTTSSAEQQKRKSVTLEQAMTSPLSEQTDVASADDIVPQGTVNDAESANAHELDEATPEYLNNVLEEITTEILNVVGSALQDLTTQPTGTLTNLELGSSDLQPRTEADGGQPSNGSSSLTNENLPKNDATSLMANQLEPNQLGRTINMKAPWYCGTLYECPTCLRQFFEEHEIRHHLTGVHNMELKDVTISPIVESDIHECLVCGKGIGHNLTKIRNHLNTHMMTTDEYYDQYKKELNKTRVALPFTGPKLAPKPCRKTCSKRSVSRPGQSFANELSQWFNRCKFGCKICPSFTANCYSSFNQHRTNVHHLYGTAEKSIKMIDKVFHVCQLCGSKIHWDRSNISKHLMLKHNSLPAESYYRIYKEIYTETPDLNRHNPNSPKIVTAAPTNHWNDRCTYGCQICYEIFPSRNALRWHLNTVHKMPELFYLKSFQQKILHKSVHSCIECGEEILFDSVTMRNHFLTHHKNLTCFKYKSEYVDRMQQNDEVPETEENWMSKCFYYCPECDLIFASMDLLRKHINKDHSVSRSDFFRRNGSCVFEEISHTCLVQDPNGIVCQRQFVWNEYNLKYHLGKHNLESNDYFARYMTNYKETLVNLFKGEDWANKCSFLCIICNQKFESKTKLWSHYGEEHNIEKPEEFYESSQNPAIVKYVLHTCQICRTTITWEKVAMAQHMNDEHKITCSEYARLYLSTYEQSDECREKATDLNNWINRCIFECLICNHGIAKNNKRSFRVHLVRHHKKESKGYFSRYGDDTYIQKSYHVCQICLKSCLWTQEAIYNHLNGSHKIHPDVYRAKYMSKYTEVESDILDMRKQEQDLQKIHKSTKKSASNAAPKSSWYIFPSEIPDEGVSDEVLKWARGCLYACEVCDKTFAGSKVFNHHLVTDHSITFPHYLRVYRSNRILKRHHFCKMCKVNIIHDEKDLKIHFQRRHDMSVTEYFNRFKDFLRMPSLLFPSNPKAKSVKRQCPRQRKQICYAEEKSEDELESAEKSHLPQSINRKRSVEEKEGGNIAEAKKSKPDVIQVLKK